MKSALAVFSIQAVICRAAEKIPRIAVWAEIFWNLIIAATCKGQNLPEESPHENQIRSCSPGYSCFVDRPGTRSATNAGTERA